MAALTPRVAVSALFALDGALLGGWVAHLPDVQRELHLTTGRLGLILLASSVGTIGAIVPLAGPLIHRFGSRRVALVAAMLALAIVPWHLRVPTPALLAVTLFLMGATNGTLDVAMNAHSVVVQSRLERPILSSVHGWFCIGGFIGGAGTALANVLDVSPATHLVIASIALAALLVLLAPGLLPNDADQGQEGAKFVPPHGRLLALGLLCLVAFFAEGAIWDWSAVYLRNELAASPAFAALGFGVGSGAMAIGRLRGDAWVARRGPSRVMRISGVVSAGGLLLATVWPSPVVACLGFALAGIGLANTVPILFGAAARVPGVAAGAGLASVVSLGYAAFLGGPPLVGNVAQATSLRVGLALVGAFAALLAVFGPRVVE